ncbi:MAG TPA: type II toxin-antitoxin system VapC family toxin [Ilumatobacteraceae bacterium]|nr:type II toxin-antitoxin system VapC family toxin [Ilumatobacteraceae bacterium]
MLLDTHAFVWALTTPDRLSDAARSAVSDRAHNLHVSAASVWEMAIKVRSGKWPDAEPIVAGVEALARRLGAIMVGIDGTDARCAGLLDWGHRDPFDRMLAAQATNRQFPLITRDTQFRNVTGLAVVW